MTPQIFGRYTLIQRIGEGGMADVFLAEAGVAEGLKKRVVIKKIRSDVADQPEFMRMFVAEAEVALGLNHANIVQVFDFGRVGGAFYLAMELVEGVDLMRMVRLVGQRGERVPIVIAAYIAHQVAAGLAYAHAKRDDFGRPLAIVHRDISPHNIMLSLAGTVKILDFGIARTAARARRNGGAEDSTIQGKIAYMSPEQANGWPLDARSDIYSLGVVLYELLIGELVFRDADRMAALEQVRTRPLPPLRRVAPEVPEELAAVVDRALAREPSERWDSARAMQSALSAFLHRADPVVDDEVLSAFVAARVPDPLFSRGSGDAEVTREIEGSQSQLHAPPRPEVRRVVLLKAALAPAPGAELPAEPARFYALARDIAYKRDAQVCELGPRGLLLVFGAVLDPGDVDEAALRAALALREAASEAAPGHQIGVVLAAAPLPIRHVPEGMPTVEVGHDLRRHLQAMADGVLDGPVLVAGDLAARLGASWQFGPPRAIEVVRPRRAVDLTGGVLPPWASALAQAAPLLGPVVAPRLVTVGGRQPLYGRELELKLLRDNFAEAIRARVARTVLVVGGPGIGKRALLDRFLAALPRGGCVVLRARGQWRRRNVPLGVFHEMLRQFLDAGPDTSAADIESRLVSERVVGAGELAQALARALGVSPGTGTIAHARSDSEVATDPQSRRERLWRPIRRLIRALAQRRPVLVVVEDLHYVDAHSAGLLREWLQEPHSLPLMGLATARPGPRADELRAMPRVHTIELRELDDHARRELVVRRFDDPAEAEELAAAIVARTGGNPLFIEETLADLLRRGVIGPGDDGRLWRVHQRGARIDVPPSVEDALLARLDALDPEVRALIDGAAVLGLTFRTGELAALLAHPVAELAAPLAALVDAGLLERPPLPAGAPPAARFATLSLHEVARANLAPGTCEAMHARAAELKAARADYQAGRDDGPIADHWAQARRPEAAIEPALRAARFARDVAGNVEAYYYLSLALRSMRSDADPRAWDALREREAILAAWGRRRAQGADLRALLRLALGNNEREVYALGRLLRFYLDCGRIQRAEQLFPRLARQTESLPDADPHRALVGELGSALMLARDRPEEAERLAAAGLAHCPPEAAAQRCRLHAALGRSQLAQGRLAEAVVNFEATLHLAQKTGLLRLEGEALNSLGEVAGRGTRYQEAVDYFRAALQVDRDLGDRAATGTKLANLGIVYTAIGLYRRAERYLRKALELHEAIGHPGLLVEVVVNLGEVSAEHGDVQAARALLLHAADMAAARGDARTELRARARLARALLDGGPADLDEARALAEDVLARARGLGLRTATCRALHVLSRLSERAGDLATARALEEEAVALVRAGAAPIDGVLSIHHLGRLLADVRPAESSSLLADAAAAVRARLEGLRDEDLRRGYLAQAKVREILGEAE
ncbi:serine/threonine-protein kinase [Nannocystis punicea]|uniref:Protein kinase n=1 Tax=Nannocystis punicea TaxID=2995304 RepID=A0ABY7HJK3_9BACT|nr:protein kinase [Nannocystis poenicansa]WAS99507.1 protein kinase [Nannocystis poenicansa]